MFFFCSWCLMRCYFRFGVALGFEKHAVGTKESLFNNSTQQDTFTTTTTKHIHVRCRPRPTLLFQKESITSLFFVPFFCFFLNLYYLLVFCSLSILFFVLFFFLLIFDVVLLNFFFPFWEDSEDSEDSESRRVELINEVEGF